MAAAFTGATCNVDEYLSATVFISSHFAWHNHLTGIKMSNQPSMVKYQRNYLHLIRANVSGDNFKSDTTGKCRRSNRSTAKMLLLKLLKFLLAPKKSLVILIGNIKCIVCRVSPYNMLRVKHVLPCVLYKEGYHSKKLNK